MSDHAWSFYLGKCIEMVSKHNSKSVLKTDTWNEAKNYPNGGIVPYLMKLFPYTYFKVIDIDNEFIAEAKARFPSLDVGYGDIRALPFESNTFDMILDMSTLDHILESDIPSVITEYSGVLRQGGILALVCWFTKKGMEHLVYTGRDWDKKKAYYHNFDNVVQLLNSNGLVVPKDKETNNYLLYSIQGCYDLKYFYAVKG